MEFLYAAARGDAGKLRHVRDTPTCAGLLTLGPRPLMLL